MHPPPETPPPDPSPVDIERLRALLERTRDFLEACRRDPWGAVAEEDPTALLSALDGALAEGAPGTTAAGAEEAAVPGRREPERGVIRHLRTRRSA